jgi:tRNA (cytidine/uridine-2'-O-)-methyltransferase
MTDELALAAKKAGLRLALYQPDMPPNTGTMMRLCACLGVGMDIIEPCGFPFDDAKLRRAAMDYIDHLDFTRHRSWDDFAAQIGARRLVLLTTKGAVPYTAFSFQPDDILMVGRESAGVPDDVHARADARIVIPILPPLRSLNVAISAAMTLGEAQRQLGGN